jgi:hypothetical protein
VECFKRIEDELPCYNQKGEPYFPASDKAKREELLQKKKKNTSVVTVNTTADADTIAEPETRDMETGQPSGTGEEEGSVFPTWV